LLPCLLLASVACRVDRAEFEERVFSCNTAAPDPACGTDDTGRAMACFGGRQLGASDFCAKTCDEPLSSTEDALCLAYNVSLRACNPANDATGKACEQQGLACFRTDLQTDVGVCTTMSPCDTNQDCLDPVRSVCATSFLSNSIYPMARNDLKLDHLFCLQTGCKSRGTSCSPGETCLQEVIPTSANPPDICVPNCDSHNRCPPNFLCYSKASTDASPNVCIPGLLGFACETDIDCMIGTCREKETGYKFCTAKCNTLEDCSKFDGPQGKFLCVKNPAAPLDLGYCETPNAYRGTICDTTADCAKWNPGDVCDHLVPGSQQGVCLPPCSADGKCNPRGGINHTCVPSPIDGEPPVCYPGYFGYPCEGDNNCVDNMVCRPTFPGQPSVCSGGCASDADCAANRWIAGDGWCGKDLNNPSCLPAHILPNEAACPTDLACKSGNCVKSAGMGLGMCAP
jgi:hypothetical protein